jgi:hypothetical protein
MAVLLSILISSTIYLRLKTLWKSFKKKYTSGQHLMKKFSATSMKAQILLIKYALEYN